MMDLINPLNLSALTFRQMKAGTGEMMGVIAVRGTFYIYPGWPLIFAEKQDPIQLVDEFLGDPHTTPLMRVSDLIPFKPKADLTLIGWALLAYDAVRFGQCFAKCTQKNSFFEELGDELNRGMSAIGRGWNPFSR